MTRFQEHATESGSTLWNDTVTSITETEKNLFTITTSLGKTATADFVLLATGNVYRKLGVE